MQLALADRFWQQRMLDPHPLDQAVLEQHSITPDSLLQDVRSFIGRPYLHIVRPVMLQLLIILIWSSATSRSCRPRLPGGWSRQRCWSMDAATLNQQVQNRCAGGGRRSQPAWRQRAGGLGKDAVQVFTPDYLAS
ncbi:MAG: hypothetical protein R3E89_05065 [Thiolinea sp.]